MFLPLEQNTYNMTLAGTGFNQCVCLGWVWVCVCVSYVRSIYSQRSCGCHFFIHSFIHSLVHSLLSVTKPDLSAGMCTERVSALRQPAALLHSLTTSWQHFLSIQSGEIICGGSHCRAAVWCAAGYELFLTGIVDQRKKTKTPFSPGSKRTWS